MSLSSAVGNPGHFSIIVKELLDGEVSEPAKTKCIFLQNENGDLHSLI